VDVIWGNNRPAKPTEPVKILPQQFAGMEVKTKLEELRKELDKKKSSGFIVSMYAASHFTPYLDIFGNFDSFEMSREFRH